MNTVEKCDAYLTDQGFDDATLHLTAQRLMEVSGAVSDRGKVSLALCALRDVLNWDEGDDQDKAEEPAAIETETVGDPDATTEAVVSTEETSTETTTPADGGAG